MMPTRCFFIVFILFRIRPLISMRTIGLSVCASKFSSENESGICINVTMDGEKKCTRTSTCTSVRAATMLNLCNLVAHPCQWSE